LHERSYYLFSFTTVRNELTAGIPPMVVFRTHSPRGTLRNPARILRVWEHVVTSNLEPRSSSAALPRSISFAAFDENSGGILHVSLFTAKVCLIPTDSLAGGGDAAEFEVFDQKLVVEAWASKSAFRAVGLGHEGTTGTLLDFISDYVRSTPIAVGAFMAQQIA
jgi:hypothetical protein